ncbi:MAG: DUF1294 domain-containing protein [Lachnospiraceae bacterium]|nr:DUF1294 domain-containing protein [Lachnospiraceae bacterium]
MEVIITIVTYFLIINIIGFAMMGIDKWKAKHHAWRIPENTLFIVAIIGGSLGAIIGMYTFRHKTKHWYFVYGLPAILALQVVIISYLIGSGRFTIMF